MALIISNPHPSNTIALIAGIWKFLSKTRRNQIYFTLGFTIINAFLEVLTISSVIPFLTVLSSPDKVFSFPFVNTSFNAHEEPIIQSASDGIAALEDGIVDELWISKGREFFVYK